MLDYQLRLLPGLALFIAVVALLPRRLLLLRAVLYILIFVLVRDLATPLGMWRLGAEHTFWLRFAADPTLMWMFSGIGLLFAAVLWWVDPELRALVTWHQGSPVVSVAAGIGVAVLITAPWVAHGLGVPLEHRGGAVEPSLITPILGTSIAFNLVEELLFRGYYQGALEHHKLSPQRAAVLSGLTFGAGHAFLASTVTDVGWPLLLFATWEGLIVAFLRTRLGLLAAVVAHGLAIAIMASAVV
jgi:membrane protease YdiL (CAAX protease family)